MGLNTAANQSSRLDLSGVQFRNAEKNGKRHTETFYKLILEKEIHKTINISLI